MKVCFFSTYFFADYVRQRVILEGLRENNVEVIECIESGKNPLRYIKALIRFAGIEKKCDLVIVGFRGHEILPFVRFLTRKPIVFDAFISLFDTVCTDQKRFDKKSVAGKFLKWFDKKTCEWPQKVLLDTQEHINFFSETFSVEKEKFEAVFVGADKSFYPRPEKRKTRKLEVLWYGNYIPLHGAMTIAKAFSFLRDEKNLNFTMIGNGQTFSEVKEFAVRENAGINFLPNINYGLLPKKIAQADICLSGPFGTSKKTNRVILGKTFQLIAMKKPLILSDTPANRELFKNGKNCVMVKTNDHAALSKAILRLKNNAVLRKTISENAFTLFNEKATPKEIGKKLKSILRRVMENP